MSNHRELMAGNNPVQNRSKSDRWLLIFFIVIAVLTREETTDNSRVCYYDANGIEYAVTVRIVDSCPFTIEVDQ